MKRERRYAVCVAQLSRTVSVELRPESWSVSTRSAALRFSFGWPFEACRCRCWEKRFDLTHSQRFGRPGQGRPHRLGCRYNGNRTLHKDACSFRSSLDLSCMMQRLAIKPIRGGTKKVCSWRPISNASLVSQFMQLTTALSIRSAVVACFDSVSFGSGLDNLRRKTGPRERSSGAVGPICSLTLTLVLCGCASLVRCVVSEDSDPHARWL